MRQKVHLPLLLMCLCILGMPNRISGEIPYCSKYSSDQSSCLACQTGYSALSSTICQADCDELFYFDSSAKACSSLCSLSEIGNDTTKTCDTINPCPNYSAIGQSFHTDVLNSLIIHSSTSELITSCSSDTSILVWDAQSGGQRANFQGHSVAPLSMFFLESSNSRLLSFSSSEVIIWDYSKAIILSKATISYGQLTSNSQVNQSTNQITSFGFQGEFFIVDYVALTSSKFIGHSNIVETVLFIGSSYLISSAKDKLLLLWQVSNTNLPIFLTQLAIKKIAVNYLSISGKLCSFVFALGGSNSGDNNQIIIAYIDAGLPPADIASQFKLKTQNFQDHQSSAIIDFILDSTNNYFISYSANEIIVYQGQANANYILEFSLKKRISANSLLGGIDSVISSCALVDKNKFVIGTLYGQVYLFNYFVSSDAILSPSQSSSNSLEIQREQTNSNFMFQYSASTDVLFIYSEQVLAVNFSTLDVSYIINNWITPPVLKHSSKVLDIDYSELSQIMATVSTDSYCFVYDFISTELLTIITHPSNINVSKTAALVTPLKVAVVRDLNVCVSYIDFSLICYDPISGNINYRYTGTTESLTFLKQDYARNYLLAAGQSLIVVFDLNNKAVFSQFSKANQFSVINFQPAAQLLYTSTPFGYYIKFSYPILSIDKAADQSSLNINNQVINGWTLDDANNMGITFYNGGLVILIYADLSPLKNIQYTSAPTTCGINFPYIATCATITGGVVGWSLYTAYEFEQQLLDFPIEKGLFSFKYGKAYLLINYQAYGTAILIGNLQYLLAEQTFDTTRTITNFIVEESRMRVLTTMGNGDVSNFHFTPVASSLVAWKDSTDTSTISRIIVYQESYKLVILSVGITIYDYLNSAIFKQANIVCDSN